MAVRVGVIGAGTMGQQHIATLARRVPAAQVVAISDVDQARATSVAGSVAGSRTFASGPELIRANDVDAVLVASWGPTHEELVLAAIEAGKPVLCEKPLATTTDACRRILAAETAGGRALVQVGFMRRYDPSYRALKQALDDGRLGAPLLIHCAHRNRDVPPHFAGDMPITDSAIHEIDIVRWLLDDEIAAASVLRPRRSARANADLQDPLMVVLEMAGGALVDVEVFVTAHYGYDIRCEVVCELGAASLGDAALATVRRDGRRAERVPDDFRERFDLAYELELRAWVAGVSEGVVTGPGSWDGYAATAVADACVAALNSGERVPIRLDARPALYCDPAPTDRAG